MKASAVNIPRVFSFRTRQAPYMCLQLKSPVIDTVMKLGYLARETSAINFKIGI